MTCFHYKIFQPPAAKICPSPTLPFGLNFPLPLYSNGCKGAPTFRHLGTGIMNTVPHILFDSAKQAGLLRYNYAQGDLYCSYTAHYQQHKDLYMHPTVLPRRKSKTKEAQEKSPDFYQPSVHMKKQKKVYAVEQTARQHQQRVARNDGRASKAVDEDLYKIPPEQYPKKKKVFGFFSSCLV